jgi:hypothetical protein
LPKPIDIFALLRRGGEMTAAEEKQLLEEWQEAKLSELSTAINSRSLDQPVKVMPLHGDPPKVVRGYFTQEKFIVGKTPAEMERVLGVYGKLSTGAFILEFTAPLLKSDYESRAYTYLPDGKPYKPDPNEKVYLPGAGAPQWKLTGEVQAKLIVTLRPGQAFLIKPAR